MYDFFINFFKNDFHFIGDEIYDSRVLLIGLQICLIILRLIFLFLSNRKRGFLSVFSLIASVGIGGALCAKLLYNVAPKLDAAVAVAFLLVAVMTIQTIIINYMTFKNEVGGIAAFESIGYFLGIVLIACTFFLIQMDGMPSLGLVYIGIQLIILGYVLFRFSKVYRFPDRKEQQQQMYVFSQQVKNKKYFLPLYLGGLCNFLTIRLRYANWVDVTTGNTMVYLDNGQDYLSKGQLFQSQLGVCSYDVWVSEDSTQFEVNEYNRNTNHRAKHCDACNFVTMVKRKKVISMATYDQTGLEEIHYCCLTCQNETEKVEHTISKLVKVKPRVRRSSNKHSHDNDSDFHSSIHSNKKTKRGSSFGGWSSTKSKSSSSWGRGKFGGGGSSTKW